MAEQMIADLDASGIYQIRNRKNGKRYIGSAKSFRVRWGKHLSDLKNGKHHSAYLQRSWGIHGEESFAFEVIELCDRQCLIDREQAWIDQVSPEYNVSPTAGNCLGVKHSEATKLKHSIAMRGRKFPEAAMKRTGQRRTPEQKAKMSEAQKKARAEWSEEAKASLAESNRQRLSGKKQSPEWIAARSAGMRGHEVSQETRDKISAANKGRKRSPEVVAAMSAARKGKKRSQEVCERMRGRKLSLAHREKISLANKGRVASPETCKKISQSNKGKKLTAEAIAKRTASRSGWRPSEEQKAKISESLKGTIKSDEARRKLSASKKGKKRVLVNGRIRYV